jgi:ABC-type sugar transport system permease subunit
MAFIRTMKRAGEKLASYLFILPAFALVVVLLLVPMVQNIYYSFFDWDGIGQPVFEGFGNYTRLLADRDFLISIRNTVLWVACWWRCSWTECASSASSRRCFSSR